MTVKDFFKTALKSLSANKSRSLLTMLGIVIGVAAIIIVMSLGRGAQDLILGEIQSIGSKTIAVLPGRQPKGPADIIATLTDSLKQKDLDALSRKANVPHLEKIMPVVFGTQVAAYENETYRPTIFGATNLFAEIYDIYPESGRLFGDEEIKNYADVVIIGSRVKEELFGQREAVGEKIKIKGRNFKVVGVFGQEGQTSFLNFDEIIIVPYTTAQRYIFGIKHFHRIAGEVDEEKNVPQTAEDIQRTLRIVHDIDDPSKDDFHVETMADAMEMVGMVTSILTLFLAAVAAISLVVGGIGIMNIMLVSVTERTREIGLRKAIGATDGDILKQFLLEAVLLTTFGGTAGIALGGAASLGISMLLSRFVSASWPFAFPVSAALIGFAVAAAVGLIFGLYPARRAAEKSPIEALRYE